MGNIQQLDDNTINKIAAGEVVGRPVSVVKELIENSIDAKADRIKIECELGGKSLIKITDNGTGMDKNDAEMCFARHATSKLISVEDLLFLDTMGFRGEAIASIASVAKVALKTKRKEELNGTEIIVEGGKIMQIESYPLNNGTTFVVKDLFYNIPARAKFLKNDKTELSQIIKLIQSLSLIYPGISFELFNDKKKIFYSSGNNNLEENLAKIFSLDVSSALKKISFDNEGVILYGYISIPGTYRSNKDKQFFAVNKRLVTHSSFHVAIKQATEYIFAPNQFPYIFIDLKVDPSELDVNVHPAKTEVKFLKERAVYNAILESIKAAFNVTTASFSPTPYPSQVIPNVYNFNKDTLFSTPTTIHGKDIYANNILSSDSSNPQNGNTTYLKNPSIHDTHTKIPIKEIFQYQNTYLIFSKDEELWIIDQHAAHERILFEGLRQQNKIVGSQELLLPESIFISALEVNTFRILKETLFKIGYNIEEFGNDSLIIRSVPLKIANANHKEILTSILAENNSHSFEKTIEKTYTTIACKAAIKAGDSLSLQERQELIEQWLSCDNCISCPHGRPSVKIFKTNEIAKWFNRS